MEHVDVAIVGGGPAGSSAAEKAAVGGSEAVVFEKGVPRADREEPGPDSTDAAGMLDFWLDMMKISHEEIPDEIIHQEIRGVDFIAPSTRLALSRTTVEADYPHYGFTFDRTGMDDWLAQRARDAGAEFHIGRSVTDVTTTMADGPTHRLTLSDGEQLSCDKLILADGPQRQVTLPTLEQFLPPESTLSAALAPQNANHIGYQEYRRVPEDVFESDRLGFWWGHIPGETAYPWIFPNDDNIVRIGLTMPIGLSLDNVPNPEAYPLIDADDEQLPSGAEYIRRLLEHEYGDEYDIETDFPRVTDRGKRDGTETYPISSTPPIDSPVEANIAIAGGAMGTTSVFHEGGYHTAVRTGKIAGRLAAADSLDQYNTAWQQAVGWELRRHVAFADMVEDHTPTDWSETFETVSNLLAWKRGSRLRELDLSALVDGIRTFVGYRRRQFGCRNGGYVQFTGDDYVY